MKKILASILLLSPAFGISQLYGEKEVEYHHMSPALGVQIGVGHYYGELMKIPENSAARKMTPGFGVYYLHPLTKSIQLKGLVNHSKLSHWGVVEEGNVHNFLTKITSMNIGAQYRIDNDEILPSNNFLTAFVGAGVGFGFFKNLADITDRWDEEYHYWDDGTIRNKDQNSPDAWWATVIRRDYTYETDVSSLNNFKSNGLAYYVEGGFGLKVTPNLTANFTYQHNFLYNDYLDGVSTDNRKDHYNALNFSMVYNFGKTTKTVDDIEIEQAAEELELADEDNDGVIDLLDKCPHSDAALGVDEDGCVLDQDKDGVPDALDAEPNSPHTTVDEDGKAMTDEEIQVRHLIMTGQLEKHEKYEYFKAKYDYIFEKYDSQD